MKFIRHACGIALPLLGVTLLGFQSNARAQNANLLANPGFTNVSATTNLPQGYTDQVFFNGSGTTCPDEATARAQVPVVYTYGVDGGQSIDVDITNNSTNCTANYNLFFPTTSGSTIVVTPGGTYTLSASVKLVAGNQAYGGGGLGYNLNKQDGSYLGGAGAEGGSHLGSYDVVTEAYKAGLPVNSVVPYSISPALSRYGVQPGAHVHVRMISPSLTYAPPPTTASVNGLDNPVLWTAQGKTLKLSVPLVPLPLSGTYNSRIALVDANGVEQFSSSHVAPFYGGTSWQPLLDGWQVTTPQTLPEGHYIVRYSTTVPAAQTAAGAGALETVSVNGTKSYQVAQLIVDNHSGSYVGEHFHRYPPGPKSTDAVPVDPTAPSIVQTKTNIPQIHVGYQFVRSHDNDAMAVGNWWLGSGRYDWTQFDQWANLHSGSDSAPLKKLLITFFGTPTWISSDPTSVNNGYHVPGLTAPPTDLNVYTTMVFDVVKRYKSRIFAVECWNEPDVSDFFSGDPTKVGVPLPTQLADMCKAIHVATKAVDPTIVTICPQVANASNMKTWLGAKTSSGEPITNFCDVVGAHGYELKGSDAAGVDYGSSSLRSAIASLKSDLATLGVSNKPIAVTETGFNDGNPSDWSDGIVFSAKTAANRGNVLYQTFATARELGVSLYAWYAYDNGASTGAPFGLEGTMSPNGTDNSTVLQRVTQSVTDLGATSNGLQGMQLDIFQLPSKSVINYSSDGTVSFTITVTNPGLLPISGVSVADAVKAVTANLGTQVSSTLLTLDSATGGACSNTASQVTCMLGTMQAEEARVVTIHAHMNPSALQQIYLASGGKYTFTHAVAVQWNQPVAPASPVNPAVGTPPAVSYVTQTATDTKMITGAY